MEPEESQLKEQENAEKDEDNYVFEYSKLSDPHPRNINIFSTDDIYDKERNKIGSNCQAKFGSILPPSDSNRNSGGCSGSGSGSASGSGSKSPSNDEHSEKEKSQSESQNQAENDGDTDNKISLVKENKKKAESPKNILKNYGRSIIKFVRLNVSQLPKEYQPSSRSEKRQLMAYLKKKTPAIRSIHTLREFWNQSKFSKTLRVLSIRFMKRYSFSYIFNSKIKDYRGNIKYRSRIIEAICEPHHFYNMKQY